MMDKSSPYHRVRGGVPSGRAGARVPIAATILVLGLAAVSGWLNPATAQAPAPTPSAGAGAVPPAGSSMPALPGAVAAPEAAPKEPVEEPPTPVDRLVDEAAAKIAKLQSVAANLRETVDMLNQQITIKGNYLKAANHRVYLRLTVSGLADTGGTTLQVCDGETFWDYESILENQAYRKFSVKPVFDRLTSPELDAKIKDQVITQMGLAGPETLLIGLRRVFRFETKEEGTLDGKPVLIVHGSWKAQSRQGLTGPDNRPVAPAGMLPPYIPSDATLYLGKDDGWPYQLVLSGRAPTVVLETRQVGPDGRVIGAKSSRETVAPTKIVLEYTDVKLNAAIQLNEFVFQAPSAAAVEDNTELMVRALDQAIQGQAQRKKAETAKKDGDVLDQSIDIPPPPASPGLPPSP